MPFKKSPSAVFRANSTSVLQDDPCCQATTLIMRPDGSNCARAGAFVYSGMRDLLSGTPDTDLDVFTIAQATNSVVVKLPRTATNCGLTSVLRSDWETPHFVPLQRVERQATDETVVQGLLTRPRLLVLLHEPEIYPEGHFFALFRHTKPEAAGTWSCIDPLRQSGKPFRMTGEQVGLVLNTASYALYPT